MGWNWVEIVHTLKVLRGKVYLLILSVSHVTFLEDISEGVARKQTGILTTACLSSCDQTHWCTKKWTVSFLYFYTLLCHGGYVIYKNVESYMKTVYWFDKTYVCYMYHLDLRIRTQSPFYHFSNMKWKKLTEFVYDSSVFLVDVFPRNLFLSTVCEVGHTR